MFSKLTDEQKAVMRSRLAAAMASNDANPQDDGNDNASDSEDADAIEKEHPPNSEETRKQGAETLRVNAKSEAVEISNIRLFSIDELELDALTACKSLSLRKNLIHELSPFPLTLSQRLQELDFFDNKIKKVGQFFQEAKVADEQGALTTQVAPNAFSSLTKLDFSYNQIRKISGLDSLAPTLKELYLVENKIKVVQGLDALVNLELLELGGNRIREIGDGLKALVNLKQLWIGKNKIANIGSSLNTLESLQLLSLQANRIVKLAAENFPEGANPQLKELFLSENGISTIEYLPLHHLHTLDVSFNPLETINAQTICLANMPELEEFWLTDGKVDDWAEVQKLACFHDTLRTVYLERNPIEQDKRYRNKVYMFLPFLTQIDSWPVVNKENLEEDRSIQRRDPRE